MANADPRGQVAAELVIIMLVLITFVFTFRDLARIGATLLQPASLSQETRSP